MLCFGRLAARVELVSSNAALRVEVVEDQPAHLLSKPDCDSVEEQESRCDFPSPQVDRGHLGVAAGALGARGGNEDPEHVEKLRGPEGVEAASATGRRASLKANVNVYHTNSSGRYCKSPGHRASWTSPAFWKGNMKHIPAMPWLAFR